MCLAVLCVEAGFSQIYLMHLHNYPILYYKPDFNQCRDLHALYAMDIFKFNWLGTEGHAQRHSLQDAY